MRRLRSLEALKSAKGQLGANGGRGGGGGGGGGNHGGIDFAGEVAYARDMEMSSSLRGPAADYAPVPQSAFSGANGDSLHAANAGETAQVSAVNAAFLENFSP